MKKEINDKIVINGNSYFVFFNNGDITVTKDNRHITFNNIEIEFAAVLTTYLTKRGKTMATEKLQMTNEQAKAFATSLISNLIDMNEGDEWASLSLNLTAGPDEGPVVNIAFLPGTTKENAIRIQNGFIAAGQSLNKV